MGSLMERTQPISQHMAEMLAPIISTVAVIVFIAQTLLSSQGPAQRLARRKQRAADPRAVSRTQSSCDGEGGWSTFLSPKKGWLSALKAPSVQLERWPRPFLGTCRSLLAALAPSNPATLPCTFSKSIQRDPSKNRGDPAADQLHSLPQFPRAPGVRAKLPGEAPQDLPLLGSQGLHWHSCHRALAQAVATA